MSDENNVPVDEEDAGHGILHRNNFFTLTPFSGWSFVYAAKKLKEIIFWYFIILIFLVMTVYNVQQLVQYHATKPTKSNTYLHSTTKGMALPNITLQLTIPLEMLLNQMPVDDWLDPESSKDTARIHYKDAVIEIIEDYLCRYHDADAWKKRTPAINQWPPLDGREWTEALLEDIRTEDMASYITTANRTSYNELMKRSALSNTTIWKAWMKKIASTKESVKLFWESLFDTQPVHQDRHRLLNQLNAITHDPIEQQNSDTFFKFLLLEAYKYDRNGIAKDVLDKIKISSDQFFTDILHSVNNVFHVDIDPEPLLVALVDWSTHYIYNKDSDFEETERFYAVIEVLIVPKKDARTTRLTLSFFVDQLLKNIYAALEEVLVEYEWFLDRDCLYGGSYDSSFYDMQNRRLIRNFYYDSEIQMQIGRDKWLLLEEFGARNTIMIYPYLSLNSKIDTCTNDTLDDCIGKCSVEAYSPNCGCLPWNMAYLDTAVQICDQLCEKGKAQQQLCFDKCTRQKHPCQLWLTNIAATEHEIDNLDLRRLETPVVDIVIPEVANFAHFIQEYEFTTEAYLSQLGAALESFSGINIVGIIHLLLFLLITAATKVSKNIQLRMTASSQSEIDITTIELEFNLSISKLQPNRMSRLVSWLRGNRFYQQTPISGFGYIASVNNVWEIIFWYVSISCFLIFMTINIHHAWSKYAQKDTQTIFQPTAKAGHLPNFTIDMHLPLIELGTFKSSTIYNPDQSYTIYELLDLYYKSKPRTYKDIYYAMLDSGEEALEESFDLVRLLEKPHDSAKLHSREIFNQWKASLAADRNMLHELRNDLYNMSLLEILKRVPNLIETPLRARIDTNLYLKLILLESIKMENNPQQLIKERFEVKDFELSNEMTGTEILNQQGWTMEELVHETYSSLSKLFYFSLDHPSAAILLTDATVDPQQPYGKELRLEFEISLPKTVDNLEFEFYSYMHMWLSHVRHWHNKRKWDSDELSLIKKMVYKDVTYIFEKNYDKSEYYVKQPEFGIDIMSRSNLLNINVRPIWQTSSNTDDCMPESLEWCSKKCILKLHKSQCSCYPWHIANVGSCQNM